MNQTDYSESKICRVCENEENLLNLLNDTTDSLVDKLKSFVDFHEDDVLPKYICKECKKLLQISFKFKNKCLATDLKYRTLLKEIKNEESLIQTIEYIEVKPDLTSDEDSYSPDNQESGQNLDPDLAARHSKIKSIKKTWPCPTCHEVFSYLDYLKHKKIHGKNIFVASCEFCGKVFKTRPQLKTHLQTHSDERNYVCDICDKKFKNNSNFHKHKRTHLPKEERPGHICEICSKISFSFASHKNHLKTHTGETPHECKICPMKFTLIASLLRHRKIHTGERKFKCQICEMDFGRKEHLSRHMIKVHKQNEQQ